MKFKILKAMSIIIIIIRSLKGKHLKKPFIDKLRVFVLDEADSFFTNDTQRQDLNSFLDTL
jgi:hypothetical protein